MKKNILTTLFVALLLPIAAMADSYTTLWKKYDVAVQKDHPQTAQRLLDDICSKAEKERAYGQLLKAQTAFLSDYNLFNPDSIPPRIERLKLCAQAAERRGDYVLAAVYESALGGIYYNESEYYPDANELSEEAYRKSMAHPDALAAAYSTGYEPFVVDGVDSKYYYDDLLHIIGMAAGDYRGMHDYYAAHGKRQAACLSALKMVNQQRHYGDRNCVKKSKYINSLDSLVSEYGDLVVCGEVAIARYQYMANADDVTAEEKNNYINYALTKWGAWPRMNILRNAQRTLTLPSFHAMLGGEMALPGVPRKVIVMGLTNIGELRVTASRLDINNADDYNLSNDKEYARLRRHIIADEKPVTDVRRYVGLPAYQTVSDTLELNGLRSGLYLVELSTDNVSIPVKRHLLHVCNIYPLIETLPGNRYRIAVVNATTGEAERGAKVELYYVKDSERAEYDVETLTTDSNGELYVDAASRQPDKYRISTASEQVFPLTPINGHFYYAGQQKPTENSVIYTDRRIYRPGQTVHAAVLAYRYDGVQQRGEAQKALTLNLTLRNVNNEEVASKSVTTDEYGMASADFVLPSTGLSGNYTLRCDYGNGSLYSFSVEEYKRPTFSVDIAKPAESYTMGDTVRLAAKAVSFAGVPVQGAKVRVKVVRRPSWFWRYASSDCRTETVYNGDALTSADGTFTVKVPIAVPDTYEEHPSRFYTFDVTADVTDMAGETQYGETSLPYSDRPTMLTCDLPAMTLASKLNTIKFDYVNNAGDPVDGDVVYYIDNTRYTCKANATVQFDGGALSSARHRLVAYCGSDTLTQHFVTFALDDRHAPVATHDWFYVSDQRFKSKSEPVFVQLGSTDSIQHVVYTLVAGDKVIADGRADLHNEVRTHALTYNDAWGDGITLSVAWVKNGTAYQHTERIERPQPDTHLDIAWTTFRDRLVPGQRETWKLDVKRPDGKPAKAQLLATLYDKSLDQLRPHSIQFGLPAYNNLPWLSWKTFYNNRMFAYSEMPVDFLDVDDLKFSYFSGVGKQSILLGCCITAPTTQFGRRNLNRVAFDAAAPGAENAVVESKRSETIDAVEMPQAPTAGSGNAPKPTTHAEVRENLNETAFFYPGLVTDDKGSISLQFTLPESVTTWQFYGLAHDEAMNSGTIEATAVAKKTVMVQPNLPRFVRSADKGVLVARISNTADKATSGIARLALLDPATEKELWHRDVKFAAKAGETVTAQFDFDMSKIDNDGLLICRVTATGRGFSDGEQHYLPVLPDRETVVNTATFVQNEAGTLDVDLKPLFAVDDKHNRLTVEYTENPEWLMIQALPTVATPSGDNAVALASALYVNSLSYSLLNQSDDLHSTIYLWKNSADATTLRSKLEQNADLKQTLLSETPWLMDANSETEQMQMLVNYFDTSQMEYRLSDCAERLARLQNADGSFSWWKGMEGSPSMTVSVATTLARLNRKVRLYTGVNTMLSKAMEYLDKYINREVKLMKEQPDADKQCPSELAVEYLYAKALSEKSYNVGTQKNIDYLVRLLAKQSPHLSIYGKSVAATVLAANGRTAEALDMAKSIKEYTVYNERTGRYFDTPKALYSWFDYRIPSQVAAIEALQNITPDDRQTIDEMKRWLLQSKRTQAWGTPVNAVNAIYAFFGGDSPSLPTLDSHPQARFKLNGKALDTPKATVCLGYVKTTHTGANLATLTIDKQSDGTSWGAVYAQFVQPTTEVADASEGMSVKRELLRGGKPLAAGETLAVGDRITVRITVNAERDYDFVQLSDRRAACLEPVAQQSGYRHGYYIESKDNVANYFFNCMSKGRHVVETEYYVDRAGQYQTGTCSVQCAYSPEFAARTKAVSLNVAK